MAIQITQVYKYWYDVNNWNTNQIQNVKSRLEKCTLS